MRPVSTPMEENFDTTVDDKEKQSIDKPYREILGSLIYIMMGTRPDICFAVSRLSQFISNPREKHWMALKRILRYLKGTIEYGLILGNNSEIQEPLLVFTDCAGDTADTKSTSGNAIYYEGGLISWKTKK